MTQEQIFANLRGKWANRNCPRRGPVLRNDIRFIVRRMRAARTRKGFV